MIPRSFDLFFGLVERGTCRDFLIQVILCLFVTDERTPDAEVDVGCPFSKNQIASYVRTFGRGSFQVDGFVLISAVVHYLGIVFQDIVSFE